MFILLTLFTILFSVFAFFRFNMALTLFLFLLPSYLIRFSIGPLPSTLLKLMFRVLVIVWIFREGPRITYYLIDLVIRERLLFASTVLFLIAATLSIFTSTNTRAALGEWKAFYVEPIIFFLLLATSIKTKKELHMILSGLILSGLVTSLLAIYQHFTGWMVPFDFWENNNTFRITGWYGFPNAVGLFLAPLIPLAAHVLLQELQNEQREVFFIVAYILFLLTAPFALFFAKSTGALVALAAGIGFLLLMYKKTRLPILIISLIGIINLFTIPSLSNIKNELLLQDRSGQIRISIWKETGALLKDHPILGTGLASYTTAIEPYHKTLNGEGIEIFHHPHNIFLTMWVNTGLLGLIGFILLLVWFFRKSFGHPVLITTAMVVLLVHGLVDSPYIKNDLALLFWILPALLFLVDSTYDNMEI